MDAQVAEDSKADVAPVEGIWGICTTSWSYKCSSIDLYLEGLVVLRVNICKNFPPFWLHLLYSVL